MQAGTGVKLVKMRIRQKIWDLLERTNVAEFPRPVYGRIPNFRGASEAAERIAALKEWQSARVIKANPDSPQYHLRLKALQEGKIVIVATPKLQGGFVLLDPKVIASSKFPYAATIRGFLKYGRPVSLSEIPKVDAMVTGCVAVDRRGVRLGKGGGFSELEYGILRELGVVDDSTPILTTVHDLQVVDDQLPLEVHDLTVDCYATPTRIVRIAERGYRPRGIYWELLTPALRQLRTIEELIDLIQNKKSK